MKLRKAIVIPLILAMTLGLSSCRATERYTRAQEALEESRPLICEKEFGRYRFDPGWVEVESESVDPDLYTYCLEEDLDSAVRPYYVTVRCEANDYGPDNYRQFSDDHYQMLTEEYGAENIEYDGFIITDNESGITQIDFEIYDSDVHIYEWHLFIEDYHVTFELTVNDEELAIQNSVVDEAFNAACSISID